MLAPRPRSNPVTSRQSGLLAHRNLSAFFYHEQRIGKDLAGRFPGSLALTALWLNHHLCNTI